MRGLEGQTVSMDELASAWRFKRIIDELYSDSWCLSDSAVRSALFTNYRTLFYDQAKSKEKPTRCHLTEYSSVKKEIR